MKDAVTKLREDMSLLRSRSLNLQKWQEFSRSAYGAMVRDDLKEQIVIIRSSYGRVDLTAAGHDLLIAQLQARESEKVEMLTFLTNVEKDKKAIDNLIRECEVRIQQLNEVPARGREDVIEPTGAEHDA